VLIILLRIAFVILAVFVGQAFAQNLLAADAPWWEGPMIGFAVAVTLIAAEHAFRRRFSRSLVAFLVGLGAGLLLSLLLLVVLDRAVQSHVIKDNLDLPLVLVTTYLVLVMVLHNADRFRMVVPFVEFRSAGVEEGTLVLDLSALADGRLLGLLTAGLLDQRVVVPRAVVLQSEAQASGEDLPAKLRGARALEAMAALRQRLGDSFEVDQGDLPQTATAADAVIATARLHNARLVSNDADLVARALAEKLRVLHLQALARHLAPVIKPGEVIRVTLEKAGEGQHQAVGHLDDGSLVVVGNARELLGKTLEVTVVRLHQTANGRMVFAEVVGGKPA